MTRPRPALAAPLLLLLASLTPPPATANPRLVPASPVCPPGPLIAPAIGPVDSINQYDARILKETGCDPGNEPNPQSCLSDLPLQDIIDQLMAFKTCLAENPTGFVTCIEFLSGGAICLRFNLGLAIMIPNADPL